ncbi:mate-domain-containing protein [Cantharellus anzutake]|uniref:mate-domain-containing protein n=1 Tax=Cantharellus anzutake TaxID=1750568 RepID=UPI001908297B|nr:mate-domain-containing protein [Cantharellus anzutake]KAF8317793.1 mate-domain-containing protein [Cantharellus anzutake]
MTSSVTGLSVILGFVSALDSLLPQAWTSSNPRLVGLWSQRMMLLLAVILVPISTMWLNAESILLMLNQEPEVAHLAGIYLKWLCLGLPAYAFNSVTRRYFQSQGLLHVPTMIVTCVVPVNIILNYVLVWGPPAIRLGFIGAPIATAISFNLISVGTCIYAIWWAPRDAWHPIGVASFKSVGVLVHLGLAGTGQLAAEWWSWELLGLAASYLGPVALASQSVLLVSCSSSYQAPYALSVAASVRIGNMLGAGNALRAKIGSSVSLLMGFGFGLCCMAIFISFRKNWAYIFNSDPEVVLLVGNILPLVAVFQVRKPYHIVAQDDSRRVQIFDATCAVTAGILRSSGRQKLGALLNFVSYYVLGIPFGLLLTIKFNIGLFGLWIGLAMALAFNALISTWIVLRADWVHEVERVQERLATDTVKGHV